MQAKFCRKVVTLDWKRISGLSGPAGLNGAKVPAGHRGMERSQTPRNAWKHVEIQRVVIAEQAIGSRCIGKCDFMVKLSPLLTCAVRHQRVDVASVEGPHYDRQTAIC